MSNSGTVIALIVSRAVVCMGAVYVAFSVFASEPGTTAVYSAPLGREAALDL